jgi:hypothetical protein
MLSSIDEPSNPKVDADKAKIQPRFSNASDNSTGVTSNSKSASSDQIEHDADMLDVDGDSIHLNMRLAT